MVKNIQGGNKSKGLARKNIIKKETTFLRTANEEGEIYAQAIKIMGGSICSGVANDGSPLTIHIRKKFRGKGKRDNLIKPGTWLLVGLHSWETAKPDKPRHCDLLEVYNDGDKTKLKNNIISIDWSLFISNDNKVLIDDGNSNVIDEDNSGIVFVDETTQEYEELIAKQLQLQQSKKKTSASSKSTKSDFDDNSIYTGIGGGLEINIDSI